MNASAHLMPPLRWFWRPQVILLVFMLLATLTMSVLCLARHGRLWSAQDVAIMEQLFWNIRQGNGPLTTMSGNSSLQFPHHYYGEHAEPVLWLFAWPAGLTRGPEALLVLQALLFAAAAWPLARLAGRWLGSPRAGVLAALGWLAQPGLWQAAFYDFHVEVVEGLALFAFADAFLAGRRSYWFWAVLYAICKEDTPLFLTAVAVLLGWSNGRWRAGCAVAALALAYGVCASAIIIPAYSPTHHPLLLFRLMTPLNCGGVLPWLKLVAGDPSRWLWLAVHLGAFAFLPLAACGFVLPVGMAVGIMWLSRDAEQAHGMIHYPFTFYPLLALAALAGAANLRRRLAVAGAGMRRYAVAGCALLALAGMATAWWQIRPYMRDTLSAGSTRSGREVNALLQRIPPTASVATVVSLTPRLAGRSTLRILMEQPYAETDWIVLRLDGNIHPCRDAAFRSWLASLLAASSTYGVVGATDFVVMLQRGASTAANGAVADSFAHTLYARNAIHLTGHLIADDAVASGCAWQCGWGDHVGALVIGQAGSLPAGDYEITFHIRGYNHKPNAYARFEVTEDHGQSRATLELAGDTCGYRDITLHARLTGAGDAEFRVFKIHRGELAVERIRWRRVG